MQLGNDLNAVDKNGETAMHGAAYKHVPSVVRFLAEKGARIDVWNQPNTKGWTPLKIAEGVQRGMNIVSSPQTAATIRDVMATGRRPAPGRRNKIVLRSIRAASHRGARLLHGCHVDAVPARISDQESFRFHLVTLVRIGRRVHVQQSERLRPQAPPLATPSIRRLLMPRDPSF